jgi:hypothetical protein
MGAQDQVISKYYFKNNILKEEFDSKFCLCNEHEEIIDYLNCNKRFKEKPESPTKKTFNTFTTKDSYTWNITYNTEITAVI